MSKNVTGTTRLHLSTGSRGQALIELTMPDYPPAARRKTIHIVLSVEDFRAS